MCGKIILIIIAPNHCKKCMYRFDGVHALSKLTRGVFKNSASPEGIQI